MAIANSINAVGTGLIKGDGAGAFSGVTTTNHNVLVGAASNGITNVAMTAGQVLIGTTAGDPSAAAINSGTGIVVANSSGAITVNATGGGLTWTAVTGATQTMAVNNGYIANRASNIVFSLPTTSAVGDVMSLTGINTALGWTISYTTSQQIFFGTSSTTITTGSLSSSNIRDSVTMVCVVANLVWNIISSVGNPTIV